MNHKPLVSVLMNCYNGEKYIKEAIDSVYAQSYPNWEIIFWDNASTDGTQSIGSSYDARLKYFRVEVNTPLGPARNLALKKATGKYISFLDADDVYLRHTLEKQVELMESSDYGLVYGGAIVIDPEGKEIERRKPMYESGQILERLIRRYDIPMVSAMIRKSVVESEGLSFNEGFYFGPDYDLFMRIAARHPIGVVQQCVAKNRRVPGSLSKKTLHLVSKEVGHTLNELERLYPNKLSSCADALGEARAKLNFYDAISHISLGRFAAARFALRPVITRRWEYLVLFLLLFLPVPKNWLLRILNR